MKDFRDEFEELEAEIVEDVEVKENFFQKHKNKILIGLGAVATAGLAALLIGRSCEDEHSYIEISAEDGVLDSIDYSEELTPSDSSLEKDTVEEC